MMQRPSVYIVDDDALVRLALRRVISRLDVNVVECASAGEFLAVYDGGHYGCVLLDVFMPNQSGLELQQVFPRHNMDLPVIMISGAADVSTVVQAMLAGSQTFLEKPIDAEEVLAQVTRALQVSRDRAETLDVQLDARRKLEQLTEKERVVLDMLVEGKTRKQIATVLELSTRAVEDRRSRLIRKLGVTTNVELVNLVRDAREAR